MVVTVTMNPAVDKTVEMDALRQGALNRIQKVHYDAGGKGINVSRTLQELGGKSLALGFLGGHTGKMIEHVLQTCGIPSDFIGLKEETRTNLKIREENGAVTEFNETGPMVSEAKKDQLVDKIKQYAREETLFVLAGSVPAGLRPDIYKDLIEIIHKRGGKVLLDADGEYFSYGMEAVPDMIKPNQEELEEYLDLRKPASGKELRMGMMRLLDRGIGTVALTLGKQGAMFLQKNFAAKCPAIPVEAHSTVGAGDAVVAALAYAWENKLNSEETIRLCMAASAAAVTTTGTKPPDKRLVDSLKQQVIVERLETEA